MQNTKTRVSYMCVSLFFSEKQGNFGPFQPPLAIEVPTWLALIMKKNNKCSIVCPDWLNVGKSSRGIINDLVWTHFI